MRGTIKLGTLLGVPVYLHWSFVLLIAWVLIVPFITGAAASLADEVRTVGFVLAIFACIVLHEMGHALAARRYGIRTRDITLLPIGGVASLERMPEKPGQELVVALAGPAVNLVIAGIIIPGILLTQGVSAITGAADVAGGSGDPALHRMPFLPTLGIANLFLVVFNLIPALPMDGGRVLRALLAMVTDRGKATAIAAAVGQVVAVGFVLVGLFTGHVMLMLVGAFVFMGAGAEASSERFRAALSGRRVGDAVLTRFRVLRASDTIRRAAEELLAGDQHDFPVLRDDATDDRDPVAFVGLLTRDDLVRAVAQGQLDAPISGVMRSPGVFVDARDDLQRAIDRASSRSRMPAGPGVSDPRVAVVVAPDPGDPSRSRVVGLLTNENLAEFVMLREAAAAAPRPVHP